MVSLNLKKKYTYHLDFCSYCWKDIKGKIAIAFYLDGTLQRSNMS
jgi:hypothetical protein